MSLIAALLLDAMFGEPKWLWSRLPHPAVLMGRLIGGGERRLNSGHRRRAKGAVLIGVLVGAMAVLGLLIAALPGGAIWSTLIAAILIAQNALVAHVRAVADGLARSVEDGRVAVSMIVGRDTSVLDEPGIARAAIESGAENLSDGVIAPAFWFAVAGLPGILIYKLVNTADSMIGHRGERFGAFGWAAARLDDVLNLIPARLTGLMIAAASGQARSWRIMWRDAGKHRSPNAGWPEAAMASALGIALSGPRLYADGPSADPWLNPDGRMAETNDISKACDILWRAWALFLIAAFALVVVT
ncbi:adenosylcobinamide-phosphate synthase [Rubricella aquisinus]|uniref:Cobalamin biosynthesis protein CobD n=1 Tax=Rubricella aquisinus TaxID=2028108 RepID=A0A840X2U1_9RHOB|nr:adenosylcobinamide-phosphate synthase CbiB [Rubricella aquisinus]MBB5514987.1 adenosylcobinamide-phosphate synthase [Rubricella aquisinus]